MVRIRRRHLDPERPEVGELFFLHHGNVDCQSTSRGTVNGVPASSAKVAGPDEAQHFLGIRPVGKRPHDSEPSVTRRGNLIGIQRCVVDKVICVEGDALADWIATG